MPSRAVVPALTTLAALAAFGCQTVTIPDPNEPADRQAVTAEVLLRNLNELQRAVQERVDRGDFEPDEQERVFQERARRMLADVDPRRIPDRELWKYGDAFRMAGDWKMARDLYARAVEVAPNTDRRVNDTLRLARAEAQLGDVGKAVSLARTTFDAPPEEKAPIMMAVLYEIVPAGEGKGRDGELAGLLRDSIDQHLQTVVDPSSGAGKAFLNARRRHIERAWRSVTRLYAKSGDTEAARRSVEESQRSLDSFGEM